jgi:hypothetical protein
MPLAIGSLLGITGEEAAGATTKGTAKPCGDGERRTIGDVGLSGAAGATHLGSSCCVAAPRGDNGAGDMARQVGRGDLGGPGDIVPFTTATGSLRKGGAGAPLGTAATPGEPTVPAAGAEA